MVSFVDRIHGLSERALRVAFSGLNIRDDFCVVLTILRMVDV